MAHAALLNVSFSACFETYAFSRHERVERNQHQASQSAGRPHGHITAGRSEGLDGSRLERCGF